ncbi:MAG: oxidoreductase [Dehalococcoidia bacterium]|nr:MAG: oxidoreductase [Dehalococcoidia bacterium]
MGQAKQYLRPSSIDEAVRALAAANGGGRALAGGTDIIVDVREGRRQVDLLVDLKAIPELTAIDVDGAGGARIGAATPCYRIAEDTRLRRAYPGLVDAASLIGGVQIQSRASLGGNICTSSPAADSAPILIALGATCVIAGPTGERRLPVEQFFTGPRQNVLQDGEIVVAIELPPPVPRSGSAYLRFIPRNEMDIAVVGAGVWIRLDGETIAEARVGLGAVAPTPLLVVEAGRALAGKPATRETFEAAAEAARAAAKPISDMRGSDRQRIHLAGVITRRAIETAVQRARESQS